MKKVENVEKVGKVGKVEIEIQLLIKFYDSFYFGGGTGRGEIQSYLLRDVHGVPYISGSALKGCIAEYAAALSKLAPAFQNGNKMFGTGGIRQGSMFFENGTLVAESEYYDLRDSLADVRTGVSISRYTGAKKEGQLYTVETCGMGGKMVFQSSIHGFLDADTCQRDIAHLVAAIRLIYALGGKCSSGLGWLQEPIACCVKKGPRGYDADSSQQQLIETAEIDQWIREQMGG